MKFRRTHPITAESTDPTSTPSLAWSRRAAPSAPRPAYERSAMNIDTVNPIPQTTQTLAKAFHVVFAGSFTKFSLTARGAQKQFQNVPTDSVEIKVTKEGYKPIKGKILLKGPATVAIRLDKAE